MVTQIKPINWTVPLFLREFTMRQLLEIFLPGKTLPFVFIFILIVLSECDVSSSF